MVHKVLAYIFDILNEYYARKKFEMIVNRCNKLNLKAQ